MHIPSSTLAKDFAEALDLKFAPLHVGAVSVLPGRVFDIIVLIDPEGVRHLIGYVKKTTGELIEAEDWVGPKVEGGLLATRFQLHTVEGFNAAVDAADTEATFLTIH